NRELVDRDAGGERAGGRPELIELGQVAAGAQGERHPRRQIELRERTAAKGRAADIAGRPPDEGLGQGHSAGSIEAEVDRAETERQAWSSRASACLGTSPCGTPTPARPRLATSPSSRVKK